MSAATRTTLPDLDASAERGYPGRRIVRTGPFSGAIAMRAAVVSLAALVLLFWLVVADLALGDFPISVGEAIQALFGVGDGAGVFIVQQLRLPQTTVAVLVGMALALSGALVQTFARNALASPDILGVNDGAALGAVAVIVLAGTGRGQVAGLLQTVGLPMAAFVGALATAALLYVLAWRRGIDGQRLVLLGIGTGAALTAATSWLLVRARIQDAATAQVWLNGSLNARGWDQALPLVLTLAALVPVALILAAALNVMQLGDDSATALGVRVPLTQALVLVIAVALAAVAVAAVGPLAFVAFVVPQIALRLTGGARPPMLASMILGGCLVVIADLVTRVVLPFAVPAGLVTAAVGAPYLIWLLRSTNRKVSS